MKRCSSISGTGKTITCSRFRKSAPSRIATDRIAQFTIYRRRNSSNSPTIRWKTSRLQTTAVTRSAPTIGNTASSSDYDPGFTDYYLVNTADGSRKPLLTKQRGNVSLSPNAKYAIYFDGKDWYSYSVADGSHCKPHQKHLGQTSTTKKTTRHQRPALMELPAGPKTIATF